MANVHLLLDGCRGQFIPRDFVTDFDLSRWQGVSDWAREQCADPNNEGYWDAWQDILDNAVHTAPDGRRFTLHQDGDLWALCYDTMTAEEKSNFGFEEA